MAVAFSRTTRALNIDTGRSTFWVLIGAMGLLAIWLAWFSLARVTIYEVSRAAHVEVSNSSAAIATVSSGRLLTTRLAIGRRVHVGDVVATLDDDQQRLQLGEAEARLAGFAGRIAALRGELAAAQAAQAAMQRASGAERAAANAEARGADASAAFNSRLAQLQKADSDAGGTAPIDAERALADARRSVATRDAASATAARVAGAATARNAGLAAEVARINAVLAATQAEQAAAMQLVMRLRHDLALRTIRAPADGIVAAVTVHRLGDVVAAGSQLATIVPDGVLHVVANFDAATGLGRLAIGQTGRLRLDGFSWAEYGDVPATVERVASEANERGLRVELRVQRPPDGHLVLRHGMTGRVDVAIEHIAPATLLLRAIGVRFA